MNDFDVLNELFLESSKEIPKCLNNLSTKEELHKEVYSKENMRKALLDYIKNEK